MTCIYSALCSFQPVAETANSLETKFLGQVVDNPFHFLTYEYSFYKFLGFK